MQDAIATVFEQNQTIPSVFALEIYYNIRHSTKHGLDPGLDPKLGSKLDPKWDKKNFFLLKTTTGILISAFP